MPDSVAKIKTVFGSNLFKNYEKYSKSKTNSAALSPQANYTD
jgi:hypothetical protein